MNGAVIGRLGRIVLGTRQRELPSFQQLTSLRRWAEPARTVLAALIAICALVAWRVSLQSVNVRGMNDLGLVSVLPTACFIVLAGLTLGFCLALGARGRARSLVLLLYLLALIFMLYASPALVEQAPRFQVTYWLAGHTDYLLRTGTVDPYLDAYFNWPGFFVLTGLLTNITGFQSTLVFAPWVSFAYNLMYLAPMYLIYTTATRDRRLVWLGLWFFYITDWVWQDYFDPQGLNVFFYLVIIAIILKWFSTTPATPTPIGSASANRTRPSLLQLHRPHVVIAALVTRCRTAWTRVQCIRPAQIWKDRDSFPLLVRRLRKWSALSDVPCTPEDRRQRVALLGTLIAVFALSVFSHPLTPFFVLLSVTALTLARRSTPRWLPILLAIMIVGWDFTAAEPYMAGHLQGDLAQFGNLQVAATSNVTNRLGTGNVEHQFIAQARVVTTAVIWGLALLGAALRWRRSAVWYAGDSSRGKGSLFSHDMTYVLLAVAPAFMVVAQPYGGEMAMRYYLISLPVVSFFAAAAFCTPAAEGRSRRFTAATVAVCLVLLAAFLFARYGNERADYITYDEFNAVSYLYSTAPPNSLLLQGWAGTPWRYTDLEMYCYYPLYPGYSDAAAIRAHYIGGILDRVESSAISGCPGNVVPAKFVIFTRSQKAQAQMFYGVPPSDLDAIEKALLASGKFVLVYSNPDADILRYVHPQSVGAHEDHPPRTAPTYRELS